MRNVLADLAVESEAATALAMRLARAYDGHARRRGASALLRLATAVGQVLGVQARPAHAAEAMECLGGNGYVEESRHAASVPRGPAQLDLGGLAATSSALDVLRAMATKPRTRRSILR